MSEVLRERKPTARKPHRCSCCGGTIRPGVTYSRTTCLYDGRVFDWLSCPGCNDIARAVFDWVDYIDEGIGPEDYEEWAREHVDHIVYGQGARAYLARRYPVSSRWKCSMRRSGGHPNRPKREPADDEEA